MRWLIGTILLLLGIFLIGGVLFVKRYPLRVYAGWIEGRTFDKYYSITDYKTSYLEPIAIDAIPLYKEDYAQLWKVFPLSNAKLPLPVRHPLFQTVPLIESVSKGIPQFGMIVLDPNSREISRVYTLPTNLAQDYSQGQELFKLPFVRNRILKFPLDKLWKDVFSFKIDPKSKSIDEMIYDLYILHMRSRVLPKGTMKYGLIKDGKAIIEIASKDKDYMIEFVLTYDSGSLYSYVLKTEKNSDESRKLRSKFLEEISFGPSDPAMGKFLYTEFKQLNFARQVDQEGMLYLFSGWSQDLGNGDLLKEMIFYLERGRNSGQQLKPLYKYALKHYGKTFTTKKVFDPNEDPNLTLQRKIEIEDIEKTQDALKVKSKPLVEPELTPDEKMNMYLKKAKETVPKSKEDMVIH